MKMRSKDHVMSGPGWRRCRGLPTKRCVSGAFVALARLDGDGLDGAGSLGRAVLVALLASLVTASLLLCLAC